MEYFSSSAHCKCNDPGIFVFVPVLILAMIQDQALVASKHFLVETENKNLVDNAEGPPEAKLKSLPDQTVGSDYVWGGCWFPVFWILPACDE